LRPLPRSAGRAIPVSEESSNGAMPLDRAGEALGPAIDPHTVRPDGHGIDRLSKGAYFPGTAQQKSESGIRFRRHEPYVSGAPPRRAGREAIPSWENTNLFNVRSFTCSPGFFANCVPRLGTAPVRGDSRWRPSRDAPCPPL